MTPAEKSFLRLQLGCLIVLAVALAVDVWFIPTRVLTNLGDRPPLSPLYAFWVPVLSPRVLRPLLACAGYLLWFRVMHRAESRSRGAAAALWLAQLIWFVIIAQLVAGVRLPWNDLGASLTFYPGEDFWADVPQVHSPSEFLNQFSYLHRHNKLSLHGRTHPPGHTLFLWCVMRVFGSSTHAAALAILAVGATGLLPMCWLARRLCGERAALRVQVVLPVIPSVTMFAVSSSDFLFASIAAWSVWLAVEAVLRRDAVVAVVAGVAIGVAAMFSVAEIFLCLVIGLFAFMRWVELPGIDVWRQLAIVAGTVAFGFAVLRFGLGFNYLECLQLTRQFHTSFIERVVGGMTFTTWLYTSFGNTLAFSWYLGLPVLAGAALSVAATVRHGLWPRGLGHQFVRAFWLVFAVLACGGLFVLEVERIWLFLVGLVAALAAAAIPDFESADAERRWLTTAIAGLCLQTIILESLLFTIW